jgi:hypothetical protein
MSDNEYPFAKQERNTDAAGSSSDLVASFYSSRSCQKDTTVMMTKPITFTLKTFGIYNNNNSSRYKQRLMLSFLCLVLLLYSTYIQGALSIAKMRIAQLEQQQKQEGRKSEKVKQSESDQTEENKKIHVKAPTMEFDYIPLIDLVNTHTHTHTYNQNVTCPDGLKPINQVVNWEAEHNDTRKIPRIIHMTGKTVCLTDPFYKNAQSWQLKGYSFYFHDDQAVQRLLLNKYWDEFPLLQYAWPCYGNKGGATFADIWRYLLVSMVH